jgi:hypothetical protein
VAELTDDEITARAIEQALRELPEPTLEQAHDEVCAMIRMIANSYGDRHDGSIHPDDMDELIRIRRLEHAARLLRQPIPMVLHCPSCGEQHVDAPEPASGWTNPPHKSHLCHGCGEVWRPADVATTGVQEITTRGKADTWPDTDDAPDHSYDDGRVY